jgi:glucose dehydrogenase
VTTAIGRALRAFGRFWWDFLIGDSPEIFVATLVIVGLAFALRHEHAAAVLLLPALTVCVLVGSALRGRRRRAEPDH